MSEPDVTQPAEPPAPDLARGTRVGEFVVERKLGQGGMGQVYLARQQSLKREVALKILSKHLADSPTALKRFQAEAETVARISHANIVQVYAIGEQDGLRYMALEYVEGRNLKDYLARKGPPELPVALSVMRQVAAALQRASELGLVHRDIKPENILVTKKVEVKVADFGLSRFFAPADGQPLHLTQSGMTLGTPLYMAPEQVQGHPVDHRTDLYALGVTGYHLLAGHPPFSGATAFEVAIKHVQNEPPPLAAIRPDLPPDLCALVHKLMAKKPGDRYQTARDVIRDLARVQKGLSLGLPSPPSASTSSLTAPIPAGLGLSGTASAPGPVYVPVPPPSNWVLKSALGLLAVAVCGIGGWFLFELVHSPAAANGPTAAGVGLPDARLPEPVTNPRERELQAILQSRSTKPNALIDAAAELGLLLIKERRLDDAEKVFRELEEERLLPLAPPGKGPRDGPPQIVGRLGQAIVLAHRDDKAAASNTLFERSQGSAAARLMSVDLEKFLLSHPEFGEAIADALNRNAENLNQKRLSDRLEWLRSPSGLAKRQRGDK